jgi:hypothetical protein
VASRIIYSVTNSTKKCTGLLLFGWLYCNEYLKVGMSTEYLTLAFHLLEVLLMPGSCDSTSDKFYICGFRYFESNWKREVEYVLFQGTVDINNY